MYYTIYKITNLLDGKFYIGKHKTKNLDDGYMGSGILIRRAIEKHGVENFKKEVLHVFQTEAEMNEAEKRLVILNENSYNLCEGGHGSWSLLNRTGIKHTDATKQKMREAKLGIPRPDEVKQKMSQSRKGWRPSEDTLKNMSNGQRGRKHSDETKQKMAESHKGKKASEETRLKMSAWQKGKKLSEETKMKIRESALNRRARKVNNE